MKVLQINTVCGYGSTGRTCVELANQLELDGYECLIAYGQGTTDYKNSYKIGTKIENHLHNLLSRITGKQGYFSKSGTRRLIKKIEVFNPDIIHLRNLHGNYINLEILFNFLGKYNKPVVWTLHDCWAFTGKCAYYSDVQCFKWETHCKECPQVQKYPPSIFFDQSEVMFSDKRKWFNSIKNLTIITVSDWLKGEVQKSFFKNQPIYRIYNWIDHSVFKHSEKNIRNKYGIDSDKFIILGASNGWSADDNKLKDFIALSKLIDENMEIVLVGKTYQSNAIPNNIVHVPYLTNTEDLAELYSNAQVYVHLSTEDTFGKLIAEAMSCGTPTIVYNATACPETLGDGCGYVVEKRNVHAVYEKIKVIEKRGVESYAEKCRSYVLENYDLKTNIDEIKGLYNKAVARNVC